MNEDRIFVKCAWRLIPFMMLLYVVNFVDRLNVGFAALTMNRDLGFSPSVFGFGAGVFFVGYVPFQVPANVILARVGARRWIFCILAIWGLVSASTAFVQGPMSFYVLRFFLGAAEAGFFPGMVFYLTLWFPQAYRARFTANFMVAIPLAGIIGGPLSSLVLGMDGVLGFHGWQWLFLVEGLPAFLLAFAVIKLMPDGPASSGWLSAAEKTIIASRLAAEVSVEHRNLWRALRDPRVLALGLAGLGFSAGLYGTTVWLPQIVQAMGFPNLAVGFIVALPYVASMAAMVLWGRASDVRGERIWHVALPWLLAAAGFAGASVAQDYLLVLVALTLAMVGILAAVGPFFSLPSSFLRGTAAAGGIALVNAIATVGGFAGPYVIGVLREATGGYAASMVALAVGLVVSAIIVLATGRAMASRKVKSPSPNAGLRAEQIAGGDLPTES
jgi:ACS family tartrate transporter-like MFS transporter